MSDCIGEALYAVCVSVHTERVLYLLVRQTRTDGTECIEVSVSNLIVIRSLFAEWQILGFLLQFRISKITTVYEVNCLSAFLLIRCWFLVRNVKYCSIKYVCLS
jgi:hypothetical protein